MIEAVRGILPGARLKTIAMLEVKDSVSGAVVRAVLEENSMSVDTDSGDKRGVYAFRVGNGLGRYWLTGEKEDVLRVETIPPSGETFLICGSKRALNYLSVLARSRVELNW